MLRGVTLAGSFRPGAPTVPQVVAGSGSLDPDPFQLRFLTAEEQATARLMGFFQAARLELETFIRTGDLTVSDATFYRQLLDETNRIASTVNAQGAEWVSRVIPEAYSAGWRANSSVVVPRAALEALSRSTLGLITETSDQIRQSIRSSIAQGILQGLPADQVRSRILASGLSNIPHWPSVEYRAGVIARTETMRAFNEGNIDASVSNGAYFVEWIASPDEAACAICLPRDGKVYRIADFPGADDPYPDALPLPKLPAHPRCRCTTRSVYRRPDGQVINPAAPDVPPKLPPDAMGGTSPPTLPPAAGDWQKALGRLAKYDASDFIRPENVTFWRNLGRLDADQIRTLSAFGATKASQHAVFSNFMRMRYGVTVGKGAGWLPALRSATLSALERLRAVAPRYVVDSEKFHTLGDRPVGAKRFGSNTIARAFAGGQVEGNMTLWAKFGRKADGKLTLRAGEHIDAAEEVILHEFFHTIHNRYGLHDAKYNRTNNPWLGRWEAVEQGIDLDDWNAAYKAIRSETTPITATLGGTPQDAVAKLRERAAQWEGYGSTGVGTAAKFRQQADELEALITGGGDVEFRPTEYAKESYAEDFAESGMLFMLNPEHLKTWSPKRYAFFRDRVFGGWEP